ncbi:hypothetical protein MNBD_UNCLBAC01-493 [hydrothermal vent metagenome]|uniref:Uncharacterized protein n=1 Tax=hydrothermal vent metagenome TaxID=652676 RepID=A0A3B1D2T8_9ZZZZ
MVSSKKIIIALIIVVSIPAAFMVIKNGRVDVEKSELINTGENLDTKEYASKVDKKSVAKIKNSPVNMQILTVSKNMQDMSGLSTASLKTDANGYFIVPNSSIQTFLGKKVVFIDLGNEKFAVRNINVNKIVNSNSLVSDNFQLGEKIVVSKSKFLIEGLLRQNSYNQNKGNKDHGHSHGAGGHSH